jgi:hypothetical protein
MPSDTIKKYGNSLAAVAGELQPGGTYVADAYGLIQAQCTFAIDSSLIIASLDYYFEGVAHPTYYNLLSYRCHIQSAKGDVSMVTVDYMGVKNATRTLAQITGVSSTSAQPIETHPNFTKITNHFSGAAVLAGTPSSPVNNAIFPPAEVPGKHTFAGFGVTESSTGEINKKAGVRQYLRPIQTIRGMIFFDNSAIENCAVLSTGVGMTLHNSSVDHLIPNAYAILGATNGKCLLLSAVNIEIIGNPTNPCAYKAVYDIMNSGSDGWDSEIYEQSQDPVS